MPAYSKFLKKILSNKQKVEETSVVKLTEHCSAILQNKLPQKKLEREIGSIKSVHVSLQLADQTTIIPEGIVKDVLVRVDKFVFPVDFIVVNMEENKEVPLILGRPFLASGRAIPDSQERQIMLRVGEERVVFKMKEAIGAYRDESTAYSEFKANALKERAGEGEHDKCGMYLKKSKNKISVWLCTLGRACKVNPDIDSDSD
nr:uncharacterized protein LOC104100858 [Nicotiana tomentosiformis]